MREEGDGREVAIGALELLLGVRGWEGISGSARGNRRSERGWMRSNKNTRERERRKQKYGMFEPTLILFWCWLVSFSSSSRSFVFFAAGGGCGGGGLGGGVGAGGGGWWCWW